LLSAANFFLRELTLIYVGLEDQAPGIGNIFKQIMDGIDDTNAWEQTHCRFKIGSADGMPEDLPFDSFENLADRSMGHALPAVAVYLAANAAIVREDDFQNLTSSVKLASILSFFKNYLIARQLHDDAHDWKEDLERGQINAAGARLLRKWNELKGINGWNKENLSSMQIFFWKEVIPGIVMDIKEFLHCAEGDSKEFPLMRTLTVRLAEAADRTLVERKEAMEFMERYSN
jgi:hypothetical protein